MKDLTVKTTIHYRHEKMIKRIGPDGEEKHVEGYPALQNEWTEKAMQGLNELLTTGNNYAYYVLVDTDVLDETEDRPHLTRTVHLLRSIDLTGDIDQRIKDLMIEKAESSRVKTRVDFHDHLISYPLSEESEAHIRDFFKVALPQE